MFYIDNLEEPTPTDSDDCQGGECTASGQTAAGQTAANRLFWSGNSCQIHLVFPELAVSTRH